MLPQVDAGTNKTGADLFFAHVRLLEILLQLPFLRVLEFRGQVT